MGGFFGVASKGDCVSDLYFGTDYHSHLGTRRGGIAVANSRGGIDRRIHDISNSQFRSKFDDEIGSFEGHCGIGVISDTEDQPLIITSQLGTFAITTVGRINNVEEIIELAFSGGCSHLCESGDGEPNPTEIIAVLISRSNSIAAGIEYAQRVIDGSCSLMMLFNDRIYAARDRYGRTPVIIGHKDGAYAVTMETTAFPNLDYDVYKELGPGEIVEITPDGVRQLRMPGRTMKICSFFWVYYGYPSSCYENINTESTRYRNGELMVEDDRDVLENIDSICGIPDSGVAHAVGYANAAGKPYRRAFVKYTPTWPRSFTPSSQKVREKVAKMKLIPVQEQIAGKRLMFCDDSIVRGTQLRDTVGRLYKRGAKEIHMRSSCPPLIFGCRFLNFSRSRNQLDLAARRAIAKLENGDLSPKTIKEYLIYGSEKYNAMVEEVRRELNLTSLRFQKLEKLIKAIGLPQEKVCTYCWNGRDVNDEMPDME